MKKILIIDDDTSECQRLEVFLRDKGFQPLSAPSGTEGLQMAENEVPEIVLLDKVLPDIDGITLLGKIKRSLQDCYVIIVTAHQDMQSIVTAMQLGAYEYISKPIHLDELSIIIEKIIENQVLNKKLTHLLTAVAKDYRVNNIIGNSRSMEEIFKTIGIVSNTKTTVLIQGESGTGKELIAKAIHYNGPDRDKPFVSVNCAALVETLLESELFGHEKGAFTGAISRKEGKFEYARDGTIFLDEVSEMSVNLQAKLLRVLQEKEFERVGGNDKIKTNSRIIAAANKNLEDLVKRGDLRDDLYYRLKVVSIVVPPLRGRTEDIPLLAHHFLQKYNQRTAKDIKQITSEAMDCLLKYSWPGNVRELENIIERAVIFCKESFISEQELPENLKGDPTAELYPDLQGKPLDMALATVEKRILLQALKSTRWNKSEAAKRLGISRSTFMSKCKKHHLVVPDQEEP
jgi:two-component system, NtrC family, response regulator AtoC